MPLRCLVIVLLASRLANLGAGRIFIAARLLIGLNSTAGTALMTAVPFSVSAEIHKMGIPIYFLGVVIVQSLIGTKEFSLEDVPRILPVLSFLMVAACLIFGTLMMLHEGGVVSRNTTVIWEWLAMISSVVWLFALSIILGRPDRARG